MFGNVLKSLMKKPYDGTLPSKGTLSKSDSIYAPFDQLARGLAQAVEDYVEEGKGAQVGQVLAQMLQSNRPGVTTALNRLPAHMGAAPEKLVRVAELRMAAGISNPAGPEHASVKVREFFGMLQAMQRNVTDRSLTAKDAAAAARMLGCDDADFAHFLLPKERYYRLPPVKEEHAYFESIDPAAFIKAVEALETKAKVALLDQWKGRDIMASPSLLEFFFQQFPQTSAKLRDAARAIVVKHDPARVEALAIKGLASRKSAERECCAQVLGTLGTDTALEALKSHHVGEKAQAVKSAIEMYLAAPQEEAADVEGGYLDACGESVTPAEYDTLEDDGRQPFGEELLSKFREIEDKAHQIQMDGYERQLEYYRNNPNKNHVCPKVPEKRLFAEDVIELLNNPVLPNAEAPRRFQTPWRQRETFDGLLASVIDELPLKRVIGLACRRSYTVSNIFQRSQDPLFNRVAAAVDSGEVSLVQVLEEAKRLNLPVDHANNIDNAKSYEVNFLQRSLMGARRGYDAKRVPQGIWELAFKHMHVLIEALPPHTTEVGTILNALDIIADFPSVPQALVQPLLFTAIDNRTKVQEPAQKLLRDVPGIDEQLTALLSDKRQAVRANTARFLADRDTTSALPALVKRMKTEKSDVARAEMISAIAHLGGETDPYLGKAALLKEAQAYVTKLPNAKIDWLELATAPRLVFKDGTEADPALLDAWLRLALKLKSPRGSSLFDLYFDQMTPESAAAVSDWVLDAWISYDIYKPEGDAMRAKAMEMANRTIANKSNWMTYVGYTLEQMADHFYANMTSSYPNSAADTKGILALTRRATPATAGPRIAAYLKQHGRRVSQAKSLVEALAGMGSQEAVQVLVATATRFKQRTVRELAEKLVSELAEERGWTEDELADRSVPTGGFEMDGLLPLPIGEEGKAYIAQLGDDLTITLQNPSGKTVKSLPAGKDENTKESKAMLSGARKALKSVLASQQARLYEAMLTPRVWPLEDWQSDILGHPIMQRLAVRLIWRGLDADGAPVTSLRPTAEGDFWNAAGDDVDLSRIEKVDLAHTATLNEADREAWLQHLKDFEVKPLFAQVSRPVRSLSEAQKTSTRIDDREGWMTTAFKLRSAAKKLGYDRGPVEDAGGFSMYRKEFRGAGVWAELHFTGSYAGGEEDIPVALEYMQFRSIALSNTPLLEKVSPLLLSEVWNDLHEIAKVGAYDEEWQKKRYY